MPGAQGYPWHEANRSEYLAQYFLTALGVSAPVIRQEDIGVDFYCALSHEENKKLTFHSPYAVQAGSAASKDFIYGGFAPKDKKHLKWRKHGVEWLFAQEIPLFACTVDRSAARFRLYSTSAMWLLRYQFGLMTEIELCPDARHDPLRKSRRARIDKKGKGDGYSYRVPLGNPVVDVTVPELEGEKLDKAREAITVAIRLEQANITYRRLGVHVASWFTDIVPNDATSLATVGGSFFWNSTPGQNVGGQIDALKNIGITLALNLDAQGQTAAIADLAPVFKFFKKQTIPAWIQSKLPAAIQANLV
ncbi:MAG: hypothetical protein A3G75_13710 [Verrucomicrobia bacterium RIFCSPLOWO2_12_FULL_64_8]|nr:MAG: hypothetical protein A3G75_13710 [Verrucomicrobia bacterium RIFCSPLOWO2_12_FULL_64_8]